MLWSLRALLSLHSLNELMISFLKKKINKKKLIQIYHEVHYVIQGLPNPKPYKGNSNIILISHINDQVIPDSFVATLC